jgi:hypothetical protein
MPSEIRLCFGKNRKSAGLQYGWISTGTFDNGVTRGAKNSVGWLSTAVLIWPEFVTRLVSLWLTQALASADSAVLSLADNNPSTAA